MTTNPWRISKVAVEMENGKEVDADCAVEMKAEERAPGGQAGRGVLSRRDAATDGGLGRVEAELEKLPVDPGCAPVVLLGHLDHQVAQLRARLARTSSRQGRGSGAASFSLRVASSNDGRFRYLARPAI
jgi:hypothetical protein